MNPAVIEQGVSYVVNIASILKLKLTSDATKRLRDYVKGLEGAPALATFPSWTGKEGPEKNVDVALIISMVGLNSLLVAIRENRDSVSSSDVTTALRGIGQIQPVAEMFASGRFHENLTDRCDKVAAQILRTAKIGSSKPSAERLATSGM